MIITRHYASCSVNYKKYWCMETPPLGYIKYFSTKMKGTMTGVCKPEIVPNATGHATHVMLFH